LSVLAATGEDRPAATPAPRRFLLGAFGDPGHAFPVMALGEALVRRGHAVWLQTWERWQAQVEATGMVFARAPEYQVFPTREVPLKPYAAAVRAARETLPLVDDVAPDACVADILTIAPALAAELRGVPWATVVPHLFPLPAPGFPPQSIGARKPRTPAGARLWRATDPLVGRGLELGRREYNGARERLGLTPVAHTMTGLSRALTLVATLPQLEYPRPWPAWARVVGPLLWEPPGAAADPPPGDPAWPVVLVAPSTSQDPGQELVRAALLGLARSPVRVLAIGDAATLPAPPNARVVPWASYAATMPRCDLVVMHGGSGTLARALACGCAVVVCPAGGDMAENAARADWAGVGVRLPRRLLSPRTLCWAVERALGLPQLRARARAIAAWLGERDPAVSAAQAVEAWVAARTPGSRDART
jgi:UDP:flavonoid glycosyltransferase YjiC (YdhE family)